MTEEVTAAGTLADHLRSGASCAHCLRELVRRPDGALDLVDPAYVNSVMCDVRNNGFEEGLPHVEKTQWLLHGLNSPAAVAGTGESDGWQDLIWGLLTHRERVELVEVGNRPKFTHDGVTYARDFDGIWQVEPAR